MMLWLLKQQKREMQESKATNDLLAAQAAGNEAADREGHWLKVYEKQMEGRGLGSSGMRMQ